ncbi:MAG: STAS domain-containing protein, partial [Candidatus Krumholzibacteriia bacterium]
VGPNGEVTLLALEGVLDTVSAYRFEKVVREVVQRGARRILVDLSRTEFVSSAGWGTFTGHLGELRGAGGDLKLFGMNPELARIYEILDLGAVLPSFDVLGEALEDFGLRSLEANGAARAVAAGDDSLPVPSSTWAEESSPEPATAIATLDPRDMLAPAGTEPIEAAEELGELHVKLEAFGSSGRAQCLVMHGALRSPEAEALDGWLGCLQEAPQLLLVDARGVGESEPGAWKQLAGCASRLAKGGTRVHLVHPQVQCVLPQSLQFPVHASLEEALLAFQNRSTASLVQARLPEEELARDAEVRREGWQTYLRLLRDACGGEEG